MVLSGKMNKIMYNQVLLTDHELSIVKEIIADKINEKDHKETQNLTVILSHLMGIKPTKSRLN